MFGYVTIYKPELKVKDFYKYKAYYCGLCKTLKDNYGFSGQLTLTYDMTFLIVLLTSLYESETKQSRHHCLVHPVKKHDMLQNEISEYASDMNLILTYYHFLDDWQDEKSIAGFMGSAVLRRKVKKVITKYKRQSKAIQRCLNQLREYELEGSSDLDNVSGCFGELMEELFVYKKDQWESTLRRLGFFLGKFIYIMDAFDDLEEDIKDNHYNPLKELFNTPDYKQRIYEILTMMMAECTSEFEKLPCILDYDILQNILYAGVWTKFSKSEGKDNNYDTRSI